jgi:hypothetical protein
MPAPTERDRSSDEEYQSIDVALKVLSRDDVRRPQDLVDLRALQRIATSSELARARQSLALITARGYHRGRDLVSGMMTLFPLLP